MPRFVFRLITPAVLIALAGCASTSSTSPNAETLSRQQAATIRSLHAEIDRLNREVEVLSQGKAGLGRAQWNMEEALSDQVNAGNLSLSMEDRGLVVTVLDRVLFDSGSASLKVSSEATLIKLAEVINKEAPENIIYIEGHTDNVPVVAQWRSNWELSTARATEVIHYFVNRAGMNPKRFAATGYGEFQPVAANNTPDGRMKNRRVEIVISPKKINEPA